MKHKEIEGYCNKKRFNIAKGSSEAVNQRNRLNNDQQKKKQKEQTRRYKTLSRKLKIENRNSSNITHMLPIKLEHLEMSVRVSCKSFLEVQCLVGKRSCEFVFQNPHLIFSPFIPRVDTCTLPIINLVLIADRLEPTI